MEFRILINKRRKQFEGISDDYLYDFRNGFLHQFPHPVHYKQYKSIAVDIMEEYSASYDPIRSTV